MVFLIAKGAAPMGGSFVFTGVLTKFLPFGGYGQIIVNTEFVFCTIAGSGNCMAAVYKKEKYVTDFRRYPFAE